MDEKRGPTLTDATVRELAPPQSSDRGENYYGAVGDIVRRGDVLRAEVEGSQYEPFQVRIELDDTGVVDTTGSRPYLPSSSRRPRGRTHRK